MMSGQRALTETMKKKQVRILHLEDNPADSILIEDHLLEDEIVYEIIRVETKREFQDALEKGGFDVIFSDFSVPAFDGFSALEIAKAKCPDIPLIFVSGTIGEETAIETLKAGATDYVLKDRLARLKPVLYRALEESNQRAQHKLLEEELRQSQKMEAIGQLVGGVAHDFNNMLAIIVGYSDIIMQKMPPHDVLRPKIEAIRSAGQRAVQVSRQLLSFSRRHVLEPRVLDLNKHVKELIFLIKQLIGDNIEIRTYFASNLSHIKVDPGYLDQVILNLAVNARDAMPNGGELTIQTANGENNEKAHSESLSQSVLLAVSDTGCGMSPEIQARIFEPFFTTKEPGKGTGLGLATVQGIVKQSGGYIEVSSQPGIGTAFKVYFACSDELLPAEVHGIDKQQKAIANKTILIVENEFSLQQLVVEILSEYGYQILQARDGHAAMRICHDHPGKIDLLFTDIILPKIGGEEVANYARKFSPQIKILFTSGHTQSSGFYKKVSEGTVGFIAKPYESAYLVKKVSDILES